ncbi:unnamed protein product, partial [Prorocentrum cordatum]
SHIVSSRVGPRAPKLVARDARRARPMSSAPSVVSAIGNTPRRVRQSMTSALASVSSALCQEPGATKKLDAAEPPAGSTAGRRRRERRSPEGDAPGAPESFEGRAMTAPEPRDPQPPGGENEKPRRRRRREAGGPASAEPGAAEEAERQAGRQRDHSGGGAAARGPRAGPPQAELQVLSAPSLEDSALEQPGEGGAPCAVAAERLSGEAGGPAGAATRKPSAGEGEELDVESQVKLQEMKPEKADWTDDLDMADAYELNTSIWDSMVFFGFPELGWNVSATLLFGYVVNLVSQLAFCFVVYTYMLKPDVDSSALSNLLKFRLSLAHNSEFADPMTKQSLARQVCSTNQKVHFAAGQIGILSDVQKFLRGGPTLMIIAEILFLGVIVKEMDAIVHFSQAVMSLDRSDTTQVNLTVQKDSYLSSITARFEKIHRMRIRFTWALITVPRAIICVLLGFTGILFIGKTSNIDDLILNCLAIVFIIELDELVYDCLAPRRLKTLLNNMEPLPCHTRLLASAVQTDRIKDVMPVLAPVLKLIFVCGSLVATNELVLKRFFWQLEQVDHILCSEDSKLDFVYARNSANGIIYVARSHDADAWTADEVTVLEVSMLDIEPNFDWNPSILAKQQGLRNGGKEDPPAIVLGHSAALVQDTAFDASSYDALEELGNSPLQLAANILVCHDLGSKSERPSYRAALRQLMGNASIITCAEIPWEYCARREMTQLRALCPVRCNCHVPPTYEIEGQKALAGYFQSPRGGCPQSCRAQLVTSNELRFVKGTAPNSTGTSSTAGRCADAEPDAIIFGGDGSMKSSKECLVNGTVAAECGGLPPDAFWWLSFAAGLFEHLTADVAFPDIVEASVQLVFPDLKDSKRRELARWISNGSLVESFLDGHWELMRDVPHPRNLTGCDYLASYEVRLLLNADLCSAGEFSSIQFMCPVSCGCSLGEMYRSSLSPDGVEFTRVDDILMVSNRMEDLGFCPAACLMTHPSISGDSSYDAIGSDSADGKDYGMDDYFNNYYYHYEENDDCENRGSQLATDASGYSCQHWAFFHWECTDYYDDTDFTVSDLCCWCGGGDRSL